MARAKPARKNAAIKPESRPSPWHINVNEDWLATAVGLLLILYIRLGNVTVDWPIFEWFKK